MANKKYFVFDDGVRLSKQENAKLRLDKEKEERERYKRKIENEAQKLQGEDNLIHVEGKVVIKIDMDSKDSWTFQNGMKIEYRRRFNNLNVRETSPVNAITISGENINKGAEILIHPNAVQDSYRIFDYKDSVDTIRYYSIPIDMCFAWHDGNDWCPLPPYAFALNVYKPYEGILTGIEPTQLKDTLFVLTGELQNKVVKTIPFSSYIIVFQGKNGREQQIIRFRPFGDEKNGREEEAVAVLNDVTEKVLKGMFIVGISISDAKKIKT